MKLGSGGGWGASMLQQQTKSHFKKWKEVFGKNTDLKNLSMKNEELNRDFTV